MSPGSSTCPAWCGCTSGGWPGRTPSGTARAPRPRPGSPSHQHLEGMGVEVSLVVTRDEAAPVVINGPQCYYTRRPRLSYRDE